MNQSDLSWGWQRVTHEKRESQLDLFPKHRDELLAMAKVSLDDVERWHKRGWISFDASVLDTLVEPLFSELCFIRNLARSGLSDMQIEQLLGELEPPYRYHPTRTAYSFAFGWVQIPPMPQEEDVDAFVQESMPEWIADKARLGEFDLLEDLQGQVMFAVAEERARRKKKGNE